MSGEGAVFSNSRFYAGERTVHLVLLTVGLGYSGYFVVSKLALSAGVNRFVFAVYRDVIALILLVSFGFFSEGKSRPPLTLTVSGFMLMLGFTGVYMQQSMFLAGLAYTNISFVSVVQNATPVFTFMIAVLSKNEVIRFRKPVGIAKTTGILVCFIGALTLCLYRGPILLRTDSIPKEDDPTSDMTHKGFVSTLLSYGIDQWQLGSVCVIANCLSMALFANLLVPALRIYPSPVFLMAGSIFFGTVFLIVTGLFTVTDRSSWILNDPGTLISVAYSGAIASAMNFTLQTWATQKCGPLLVAAYAPSQTVFSVVFGYFLLNEPIFLGCIIGAALIFAGLYLVIWGQRECKLSRDTKIPATPFGHAKEICEPLLILN